MTSKVGDVGEAGFYYSRFDGQEEKFFFFYVS
jgi:hypothetical protein